MLMLAHRHSFSYFESGDFKFELDRLAANLNKMANGTASLNAEGQNQKARGTSSGSLRPSRNGWSFSGFSSVFHIRVRLFHLFLFYKPFFKAVKTNKKSYSKAPSTQHAHIRSKMPQISIFKKKATKHQGITLERKKTRFAQKNQGKENREKSTPETGAFLYIRHPLRKVEGPPAGALFKSIQQYRDTKTDFVEIQRKKPHYFRDFLTPETVFLSHFTTSEICTFVQVGFSLMHFSILE
jgi:hypothetical protein